MRSYYSNMHKKKNVKCNEIKQQDIDYVERLTRRIAASKVYDVFHTDFDNPSTSLIEFVVKESTIFNTYIPASKWDTDNEKNKLLSTQNFRETRT